MHKLLKNTVSNIERFSEHELIKKLSWDDIKTFIKCAEEESFRKASKSIGASPATIIRHIERLEEQLEVQLFQKQTDGITLTPEGEHLLQDARSIELAMFNLVRRKFSRECTDRGEVTISITEGLGTYWVMPRIIEFQRNYPHISLNLRCAMDQADVLRMEADISIQFKRPVNQDLIVSKIGKLHVYPFASQTYLNLYGIPKNNKDLETHRFIQQVAPQLDDEIFITYFDADIRENIAMRTNSSNTHYNAILGGAGIGILPTYCYSKGSVLVPLEIEIKKHHQLDIWMTYHPDVKKVSHKAITIEWLRDIFDPRLNPCFKDDFIHPMDLWKSNKSFHNSPEGLGLLAPLQSSSN